MQNVVRSNKKKIKLKNIPSLSHTDTLTLPLSQPSSSRGFGLIEVLVSAMILIIVVGAVVGLSRTMVKKNVETGEKVQAYNLVREGLEIGRAYRDTIWIDKISEDWDKYFPGDGEYFVFNSDDTDNTSGSFDYQISDAGEKLEKDNIEYIRKYQIKELTDATIEDLDSVINTDPDDPDEYDLTGEIMTLNVEVSWNDGEDSVQAATILSSWKPEI